jgi:propionyl-CoA carboxylase alpha chain/3-methylcrotonyl-CoA carboxylase alpha subunit/acetyl-CoA/propionyl-CoA carboxylase biotin carboxyl carrier protein
LTERANISASEAQRYFGDSRIYAEHYIDRPRHIEVQVFGDGQGNVIHLGERECSVQRRFQKIIEEAPSAGLPPALRKSIIKAAVTLAGAARYKNAGTVEFIVAPDEAFYFLEMNTRLQVEHRVTEMITGLDLVALQLKVAAGGNLPSQTDMKFKGHSIECRVCAESPERDFLPEIGRISCLVEPHGLHVLFESGLSVGQNIGTNFDSMLAKLVVAGADRQEAIQRMQDALASTVILGVVTNIDYLSRVVAHPKFHSGHLHTGFLKENESDLLAPEPGYDEVHAVLIAAALSSKRLQSLLREVPGAYAHLGPWRN